LKIITKKVNPFLSTLPWPLKVAWHASAIQAGFRIAIIIAERRMVWVLARVIAVN
jgi:hypothetical protein